MRYVLDTAFLIDHMRGDQAALDRMDRLWAEADALLVNEITVCELLAGLRNADLPEGDALIGPLEFIQPGPDAARIAGRWRAEARTRGFALSLGDALIAAAADAADATVLTRNVRDFSLTPVRVEGY